MCTSSIHVFILFFLIIFSGASTFVVIDNAFAAIDTWSEADDSKDETTSNLRGVSMSSITQGVAVGWSGKALYTSDGGVNWSTGNTPTGVNLYAVSMGSTSKGAAVGDEGVILYTINGGVNWIMATSPTASFLRGVSMSSEDKGVAVGPGGKAYHTSDGGKNWATSSTSFGSSIDHRAVSMGSVLVGATGGDDGKMFYTTDSGASWSAGSGTDIFTVRGIDLFNTSFGIVVGNGGVIYHTSDGGKNWTKATDSATETNNDLRGVDIISATTAIAVGDGGVILYTTDSGASWTTITSPTDNHINGISMSDKLNGVAVGNGGVIIYTFSVTDTDTSSDDDTTSGGGSGNAHKTRPTFGVDHNTGVQLVNCGFSFNLKCFNITDNFWTPFEEQQIKVGQTNSFTIKTYADKQLRVQEFLFGIPVVGEAHNAELGVEIFFDYDGIPQNIHLVQQSDIVDPESIVVITFESQCTPSDSTNNCSTTHLSMRFLEPLQDKVMAIKAIDFKNRYQITYLNEGFDVTGESLNPMIVTSIPGPEKYEGIIKVTQTSKYSDIWITEDGREFQVNDSGEFTQINKSYERHTDSGVMKNRSHSEFTAYKQDQIDQAVILLLEYCPTCLDSYADFEDSWSYTYPIEDRDRLAGTQLSD